MQSPPAMNEPGAPSVEALRAEGLHRHDPARFHYLEVLARRLPDQPAAVQQLLVQRLQAAVVAYAKRARSVARAAGPCDKAPARTEVSPLALLNRDMRDRTEAGEGSMRMGVGDDARPSDMKSVRQFSEVWSKFSAQQQVAQALHRAPENAGPLNSHKLMLRSLGLMQSLSPDYLRRFLSQVDSLLWLEQAGTKPSGSAAKPGRKGRPRP